MPVLEHLQPKNVLHFFEELCSIPHGSGNTKAISDYCVRFAESRGLEHWQDNADNVVIVKEASPFGYEERRPCSENGRRMDLGGRNHAGR